MAWGKAGSTTLSSTGDDIDITDLGGHKFNLFLNHKITSGASSINYTFNNDSAANYAIRININGATDGAYANRSNFDFWQDTNDAFEVMYAVGISSKEKLVINLTVGQNATGAGTAPSRREHVGKWVNTSDTIDRIDCNNDQSGDYAVDTNMSALGSDITPASAVTFPTNVQVGSRAEITDSRKMYNLQGASTISFEDDYTSNSGWTQTGSKVTVNSGKADWVDANAAATNDSLQQVIKSLGITLNDTAWIADFTYINNGGTVGGYPFVFQSGTGNYDSASNDAITMSEDNPNNIKINTKNGGTYVAGSSTIAVSSGTTYYIRIQRISATDIKLSAFTDSARTTHTSGSPVTVSNAGIANITGLTYVQHQNQTTGGGGTTNFEITDLKIYNGATSFLESNTWQEIGA